jgi:prepilin-type N-terminal cleavage/methylation domain-containing protein
MAVRTPRGFSLVELAIVVAIIGIIAAIAIPRFGAAASNATDANARGNRALFQSAIDRYLAEHNGRSLAEGGAVKFRLRLLFRTNELGGAGGILGPYLHEIPTNPYNQLRSIRIDGAPAGANTHGWHLDSTTHEISLDYVRGGVVPILVPNKPSVTTPVGEAASASIDALSEPQSPTDPHK